MSYSLNNLANLMLKDLPNVWMPPVFSILKLMLLIILTLSRRGLFFIERLGNLDVLEIRYDFIQLLLALHMQVSDLQFLHCSPISVLATITFFLEHQVEFPGQTRVNVSEELLDVVCCEGVDRAF
jgi:hypothetical protein